MIETIYMKNITQVGMPYSEEGKHMKVYFEHKVMSHIENPTTDGNIRYGILFGTREYNDNECVYIKEYVEVPYRNENIILFNDDTWLKVYNIINENDIRDEIVGWYVVNPEGREKGGASYKRFHLDNFAGINKVLFVRNEEGNDESLYVYERDEMARQSVYYLYYDKSVIKQKPEISRNIVSKKDEHSEKNTGTHTGKVNSTKRVEEDGAKSSIKTYRYAAVIIALVAVIIYMVNNGMFESLTNRAKSVINGVDSTTTYIRPTGNSIEINDVDGKVTKEGDTTTENTTTKGEEETTTTENTTTKEEPTTTVPETKTPKEDDTEAGNTVYTTYVVGSGETLYDICRKTYGNYDNIKKIVEINNIEDADKIYAGQKLLLP